MIEITSDIGDEVTQSFSFVIARDLVMHITEDALARGQYVGS